MNSHTFLKDKLFCLTGGGRGIAKGVALHALEHGAKVAIIDINPNSFENLPSEILCVEGDVSLSADLKRFYEEAKAHFTQPIDYLLANAVASARKEDESEEAFFDRMMFINFKGMYYSMKMAIDHMSDEGSIVSMLAASAIDDIKTTSGSWAEYTAIKQAMKYITRSLAANAERGIRVNAISPGWTKGERTEALAAKMKISEADVVSHTTAKRAATNEDMANAIFFLCSPESSYINGVDLAVDGGWAVKGSNIPS